MTRKQRGLVDIGVRAILDLPEFGGGDDREPAEEGDVDAWYVNACACLEVAAITAAEVLGLDPTDDALRWRLAVAALKAMRRAGRRILEEN
jgi:hypothetical protein